MDLENDASRKLREMVDNIRQERARYLKVQFHLKFFFFTVFERGSFIFLFVFQGHSLCLSNLYTYVN